MEILLCLVVTVVVKSFEATVVSEFGKVLKKVMEQIGEQ